MQKMMLSHEIFDCICTCTLFSRLPDCISCSLVPHRVPHTSKSTLSSRNRWKCVGEQMEPKLYTSYGRKKAPSPTIWSKIPNSRLAVMFGCASNVWYTIIIPAMWKGERSSQFRFVLCTLFIFIRLSPFSMYDCPPPRFIHSPTFCVRVFANFALDPFRICHSSISMGYPSRHYSYTRVIVHRERERIQTTTFQTNKNIILLLCGVISIHSVLFSPLARNINYTWGEREGERESERERTERTRLRRVFAFHRVLVSPIAPFAWIVGNNVSTHSQPPAQRRFYVISIKYTLDTSAHHFQLQQSTFQPR